MSKNKKNKIQLIPGFISNDFWRKVIALFFAVLVWERVTAKLDVSQKMRSIPVSISMPGYVLLENRQVRVDVELKGSQQHLNRLTSRDIEINVTIDNPKKGLNKVIISKHNITVPKGISVASITPNDIDIYLDKKMMKKIPVKLIYSGSLLDGYAINPLLIIPQEVTVTGPESIVKAMKYIKTEPITLRKDFVEDFDCQSKLDLEERNISVNPKEISARIEVYQKFNIRKFQNVSIKPFGYLPDGSRFTIEPANAAVILKGLKNVVEVTTPDDFKVFVDLSNIDAPGEYTLNVQCLIDKKDLVVKKIIPSTVNVTVTK